MCCRLVYHATKYNCLPTLREDPSTVNLRSTMVVNGWISVVLIDFRLVCEKLTIFPYAECIVEFCEVVPFL